MEAAEERPAARAELSLEISHLVARVVKGETLDTAASGEELAARFPGAGMSAEMIAEAIESAAGMVGLMRDGGAGEAPVGAPTAEEGEPLADDDALAAAIDAEVGAIAASRETAETPAVNGGAAPAAEAGGKAGKRLGGVLARGTMAAVRRAFFRG